MDQSPEELRHDIERTRADMAVTVDAIEDRVSPGRIVQRRKNRVAHTLSNVRERVMGVAHDAEESMSDAAESVRHAPQSMNRATQGSPLAAGAIAFGTGFLVAAAFPPSAKERKVASKAMDTLEPAKEQLVEAARESAEHLKQPAIDAAQEVKQEAAHAAEQVKATTKQAAGDAKHNVQQEVRQGTEYMR